MSFSNLSFCLLIPSWIGFDYAEMCIWMLFLPYGELKTLKVFEIIDLLIIIITIIIIFKLR